MATASELLSSPDLRAAVAAEAALEAEERGLLQRAASLEKQVKEHRERKEAAKKARLRAEEQRAAEAELDQWADEVSGVKSTAMPLSPLYILVDALGSRSQLRSEVDKTIQRLNVQRTHQVARCQQFEQDLQTNIEAMQQMQQQVRRRAVALGTAFDACVSRLSTAHVEAVAVRRQQAVAHGFVAPPTAAPKAAVALQPGQ